MLCLQTCTNRIKSSRYLRCPMSRYMLVKMDVLYLGKSMDEDYCPKCKSSRYVVVDNGQGEKTQTKIPVNVLRYLPVIPRIQRLYMMEETARQMTWHKHGKRT